MPEINLTTEDRAALQAVALFASTDTTRSEILRTVYVGPAPEGIDLDSPSVAMATDSYCLAIARFDHEMPESYLFPAKELAAAIKSTAKAREVFLCADVNPDGVPSTWNVATDTASTSGHLVEDTFPDVARIFPEYGDTVDQSEGFSVALAPWFFAKLDKVAKLYGNTVTPAKLSIVDNTRPVRWAFPEFHMYQMPVRVN